MCVRPKPGPKSHALAESRGIKETVDNADKDGNLIVWQNFGKHLMDELTMILVCDMGFASE